MDIKSLFAQGVSLHEIARQTGLSRNTVRRVIRGEHSMRVEKRDRASQLDPFKEYLRDRFAAYGLSAVRLLEEIKPMGYQGSVVTLRRFLKELKGPEKHLKQITVRFETPPGVQAQADWTECGRFEFAGESKLTIYAFVIVLSYSRFMFVRFTTSMRMAELIACHQAAFSYFGGCTKEILYDNMKQIRSGARKLNETFLDFANHYGFAVKTHRAYRPRTKGKVERPNTYLKDNFLAGRSFEGLEDLNAQVLHWLDHTANIRQHGTTGERPVDRLTQENLISHTGRTAYRFNQPVGRTVTREATVHYQGSRYSVPPAFAGQFVQVSADSGMLRIVAGGDVIAEHRQALRSGQSILSRDHLAELWKLTHEQIAGPGPNERERWHLTLEQRVESVPLSVYEQVAS